MNLRTIKCWAIYSPQRREILTGFRTKKEFKHRYPLGVPIGCVLVEMKGHYVRPRITRSKTAQK